MSDVEDLRKAVRYIEETYKAVKLIVEEDFPHLEPHMVRSADGRFILLDSLTEIVRARTVLAQAEISNTK